MNPITFWLLQKTLSDFKTRLTPPPDPSDLRTQRMLLAFLQFFFGPSHPLLKQMASVALFPDPGVCQNDQEFEVYVAQRKNELQGMLDQAIQLYPKIYPTLPTSKKIALFALAIGSILTAPFVWLSRFVVKSSLNPQIIATLVVITGIALAIYYRAEISMTYSGWVIGIFGVLLVRLFNRMSQKSHNFRAADIENLVCDKGITYFKYALFLRPFAMDEKLRADDPGLQSWLVGPSAVHFNLRETGINFETAIQKSLDLQPQLTLITLDKNTRNVGGGTLVFQQDQWQEKVYKLLQGAQILYMIPHPSEGALWEVETILKEEPLLKKTIFFNLFNSRFIKAPASEKAQEYLEGIKKINALFQTHGWNLPDFTQGPYVFGMPRGELFIEQNIGFEKGNSWSKFSTALRRIQEEWGFYATKRR